VVKPSGKEVRAPELALPPVSLLRALSALRCRAPPPTPSVGMAVGRTVVVAAAVMRLSLALTLLPVSHLET
jgi:hypothetical protein